MSTYIVKLYSSRYWLLLSVYFCLCSSALYADEIKCEVIIKSQQIAQATSASFNDKPQDGWVNINGLPDQSQKYWDAPHSAYWYKINWDYQCQNPQNHPLSLSISHINMAGKIYLNQDLLWQDQSITEPLSRSWNTPRIWHIPATAINADENIFWIYLVSSPSQQANLGQLFIGPSHQIESIYAKFYFEQRTLVLISLIINLVIAIFYTIAWLINRRENGYLFMALTLYIWVVYNGLFLAQNLPFMSHWTDRLISWVFTTYTFVACIALWRFAKLSYPKLEKAMLYLWLILSTLLTISTINMLESLLGFILLINLIILILGHLSYPYLIRHSKQIDLYFLAVIQVAIVPVALHDGYQFVTNQHNFWSPYVAPLTTIFIGFILAVRISNNAKTIASFNLQLKEKVAHAIEEREQALQIKYQLELENIKLQERMHLAHDLHDSLGGSLVRSIAIVNQSEVNLSNTQFLSMLKVLRDDLRQIIDSGSSSDNQIPATPQIWGAAIRYRFLQIFDELDIESSWKLPDQWVTSPTNFECLTFLRVIEEALTNIIKHSQARSVKIEMYYNQAQQLELTIEDNGVGFNVEKVANSGTSIGLRSMQVRLEKINARLEIYSRLGSTILKVRRNKI